MQAAPLLRNRIDILYVGPLHTQEHDRKETYGFFPYLKDGAEIYFNDVDSGPYILRASWRSPASSKASGCPLSKRRCAAAMWFAILCLFFGK